MTFIIADLHPQIAIIGHQWWWEVQYLGDPAAALYYRQRDSHSCAAAGRYRIASHAM